ncbi:MAG: NADH-quinone oxidoreductase subunit C [Anaerolineales bacterium]|nr:NADH-quinone oxidoreductase subunit C [Anaerolineales bacterium]
MEKNLLRVTQALGKKFEARFVEHRGESQVHIRPEQITGVAAFLRDKQKFELLSTITAVDYWPAVEPRFHLVYQFTSLEKNLVISIRAPLSGDNPKIQTVTGLYACANWREREIWDMFGIKFERHPDLRRIIMPQDWDGHPLRKDYPLGYEEPQFSFNFEEIGRRKPYARD